jgi:iron complex transport system ATP-binding protein
LTAYSSKELSKLVGIVYTDRTLAGALTVEELVSLGRQPYTGFFGRLDDDDHRVVADAIESVGMSHKTHDYVATLSDGERQKAMIARALAQETPIIILDEPTAFLDVASRIETMQLLRQLAQSQQKAILLSTHDVGLSLPLTDRLWLVTADSTVVEGTTEQLIGDGKLNNLFPNRNVAFDSVVMDFRVKD